LYTRQLRFVQHGQTMISSDISSPTLTTDPDSAMKTVPNRRQSQGAAVTVEIRRATFYPAVRRLRAVVAKLEVDPHMTESSDTSDTPAKIQDYGGLRTELAALADDFTPV
jgi:hypothetical protein